MRGMISSDALCNLAGSPDAMHARIRFLRFAATSLLDLSSRDSSSSQFFFSEKMSLMGFLSTWTR